jgi:mevalonate kinase
MGVARGYGKLLLFGEHSAVYGYPAIGVQLERSLDVTVTGSDEWHLPDVLSGSYRSPLIAALGEILGRRSGSFSVDVRGDLPLSVGLGSSAAFCTAILRAIAPDRFEDPRTLWSAAHALEHVFHGRPSGIDTGLSIFPGTSVFTSHTVQSDNDARRTSLPRINHAKLPDGQILLCAIPRSASTSELVSHVAGLKENDPEGTAAIMEQLGMLAAAMAGQASGEGPAISDLGDAASKAHRLLVKLGVSTAELDEGVRLLMQLGALGAKLSGAGGGGAFYGVFQTHAAAETAAASMRSWIGSKRLLVENHPVVSVVRIGATV